MAALEPQKERRQESCRYQPNVFHQVRSLPSVISIHGPSDYPLTIRAFRQDRVESCGNDQELSNATIEQEGGHGLSYVEDLAIKERGKPVPAKADNGPKGGWQNGKSFLRELSE